MLAPIVVIAFFVGLLTAATVVAVADHRALRRERAWWTAQRAQALHDGRVFDWERDL